MGKLIGNFISYLQTTNTWAALQTFTSGWTSAADCSIRKAGASLLTLARTNNIINQTVGKIEFAGINSVSAEEVYSKLSIIGRNVTDGTEEGELSISVMKAGTLTEMLVVDGNGTEIELGDLSLDGNKLRLDAGFSGDTYLWQSAANVMSFVTGDI